MLSENEIRVLIAKRVIAACDSCNSFHIGHVEGQIRGLLAVLLDGRKVDLAGNVTQIFDIAGIPYSMREDGGWDVPEEWMRANGCTLEGDTITHPKLLEW